MRGWTQNATNECDEKNARLRVRLPYGIYVSEDPRHIQAAQHEPPLCY